MSVVDLSTITNNELKQRLAFQINLDDWPDKCGRCRHPKVLHKELHRTATCTQVQESPDELHLERVQEEGKTYPEDSQGSFE